MSGDVRTFDPAHRLVCSKETNCDPGGNFGVSAFRRIVQQRDRERRTGRSRPGLVSKEGTVPLSEHEQRLLDEIERAAAVAVASVGPVLKASPVAPGKPRPDGQ